MKKSKRTLFITATVLSASTFSMAKNVMAENSALTSVPEPLMSMSLGNGLLMSAQNFEALDAEPTDLIWDNLNTPAAYGITNTYLANTASNLSNLSGYEGDVAVLLKVSGATALTIYGGSNADFGKNIWVKLDQNSTAGKTAGAFTLNGGGNAKNVAGSVNIWVDNYTYATSTTTINGSGSGVHSVGNAINNADINIDITNSSTVGAITGLAASGKLFGNVNISVTDSTTGNIIGSASADTATGATGGIAIDVNSTSGFTATTGTITGLSAAGVIGNNIAININGTESTLVTTGAITGASSGTVGNGISIDVSNANTGAIAGGAGTVSGGGVNINLANVNNTGTASTVVGSAGTVTGDISLTILNSKTTTVDIHSAASKTITGDLLLNVFGNSTTGAITGIKTNTSGTNRKITINIDGTNDGTGTGKIIGGLANTGAITVTGAANALNNVNGGISVNIANANIGAISGGAATIAANGVSINLTRVNKTGTAAAVTGSTGTVTGDVKLNISDSKTAAIIGSSGSVTGNVLVDFKDASAASSTLYALSGLGTATGNVTVNITDASSVTGAIAGLYANTSASAGIGGDVAISIINATTTGTIYGAYASGVGKANVGGKIGGTITNATTAGITLTGSGTTLSTIGAGLKLDVTNSTIKGATTGGNSTITAGGIVMNFDNTQAAIVTNPTTGQVAGYTTLSTLTTGQSITGTAALDVTGDVLISVKNDSQTGAIVAASAATGVINGNVNVSVKDSLVGTLRVDENASGDTATTTSGLNVTGSSGTVKGDAIIQADNAWLGAVSGALNVEKTGDTGGNVSITINDSTLDTKTITYSNGTPTTNTRAALTGAIGNVTGNINITLSNTTAGVVYGHNAASKAIGGDIKIDVLKSSTIGNIAGLNAASTANSVTLNINGTDGLVTTGTITGAVSGTIANGIFVNVNNANTGAISGGGATVTAGGATVNLTDVNNTGTAAAVTGSTGAVTGDVTLNITDSKTALVTGSGGSVTGNTAVTLANTVTTAALYGFNGTATGVSGGNVTVNIDTDSTIGGSIYGVYNTSALAKVSGNVAVNINGVAGTNVFAENFANTIFGGYYDADGNKAYGTLNFKNYTGDFKGLIGSGTLSTGANSGGFSQVNIDADSAINFTRIAATSYYADALSLGSDITINNTSASAVITKWLKASDTTQNTNLSGTGNITFTATNVGSSLELGGNSSAYTGTIDVNNAKLTLGTNSTWGASTIDISGGTLTASTDAAFTGTHIIANSSALIFGTSTFNNADIVLNGASSISGGKTYTDSIITINDTSTFAFGGAEFVSSTINFASTATLDVSTNTVADYTDLAIGGAGTVKFNGTGVTHLGDMSGFTGTYLIRNNAKNGMLVIDGNVASTVKVGIVDTNAIYWGDSNYNSGLSIAGNIAGVTTIDFGPNWGTTSGKSSGGKVYMNGNQFAITSGDTMGVVVANGMDFTTITGVTSSLSGYQLNSGYNFTNYRGAKIWVLAPNQTVNGNVIASLDNSNVGYAVVSNWSTINGNVDYTVSNSTLTQSYYGSTTNNPPDYTAGIAQSSSGAILGMGTTITGDINAVYKNVTALGSVDGDYSMIHMANPGASGAGTGITVKGNVNLLIDGGKYNAFRIGPNHNDVAEYQNGTFGTIEGNINAIFGATKNGDGTYTANTGIGIPAFGKSTDGDSILAAGKAGMVNGNVKFDIYSGTFSGAIALGINSGTVGKDTNLNVYGGTFNSTIYVASHSGSSSYSAATINPQNGVVTGNAVLFVDPKEAISFKSNIAVAAYTGMDSTLFRTKRNYLYGNATATFTGDLSKITWGGSVNVYGGKASGYNASGVSTFNFDHASGGFGATVNGFDRVNLDNSALTGDIKYTSSNQIYIQNGTSSLDGSFVGSVNTTVNADSQFNLVVRKASQITGTVHNNGLFLLDGRNLSSGSNKIASTSIDGTGKIRVLKGVYTNNLLSSGAIIDMNANTLGNTIVGSTTGTIIGTDTTLRISDTAPVVAEDTTKLLITTNTERNITVSNASVQNYADISYINLGANEKLITAWGVELLAGWTDSSQNLTVNLGFDIGNSYDLSALKIWFKDSSDIWQNVTSLMDAEYEAGILSFDLDSTYGLAANNAVFSQWAISTPQIPEPSLYGIIGGAAVLGSALLRRKRKNQ